MGAEPSRSKPQCGANAGHQASVFADQEGKGQVAIPRGYRLKPVEAVQRWLAAAENASGLLFRRIDAQERVVDTPLTAQVAALQVKRRALPGTAALRPALSCPARWRWPTSCRASR
jgi:hypothetical protein